MSQLTRKLIIIGTYIHTHNRSLSCILCVICGFFGCSLCHIHNTLLLQWLLFLLSFGKLVFRCIYCCFCCCCYTFCGAPLIFLCPPPFLFLFVFRFYCKNPFRNFENFITTFKHEQIFSTNHKFFINLKAHPIWIFPPISLHFLLSSFFLLPDSSLFDDAYICSHSFGSNSWKNHWSIEKKMCVHFGIKSTAMCVFVRHLSRLEKHKERTIKLFSALQKHKNERTKWNSLCVARWQRINEKVYRQRFDIGGQMKN